jgi:opacity protein-like surface antigen
MFFVLVAFSAVPALAQEKKLGLVLAYPTSVGVQWTLNDRIAFRGDGTVRWSSTTQDPSPQISTFSIGGSTSTQTIPSLRSSYESRTTGGTIGVSVLITLSKADRFRTYVSPRMAWSLTRTTSTISYDLNTIQGLPEALLRTLAPQTLKTSETTPTASVVGGASAVVHERFSVFAEAGVGYSWGTLSQTSIGSVTANMPTNTNAVAMRSGIGAVIYF